MKSIVERSRKIVTQLYERNMVLWNDLDREVVFAIQALNTEVQRMGALAQPEQEPVAFASHGVINWIADKQFQHEADLYITPPQRKPLTDEEVEKIIKSNMSLQMNLAGIRADFEAAQGIKEKNDI